MSTAGPPRGADEPVRGSAAPARQRPVRVLAVHDGDAERSQRLTDHVVAELGAVLGAESVRAALDVRVLDVASTPSRRAQRAACRAAEIVVGIDAEHLRGLARPLLGRQRVFTLEELTITVESLAVAPRLHGVVSPLEHGHAAFGRSVVAAARAGRGLVAASAFVRRRAATIDGYPPRLARAVAELAIGRAHGE